MRTLASTHSVQFCKSDTHSLIANIGRHLLDGWSLDQGLVVVATPVRREQIAQFLQRAGVDPDRAVSSGQLILLDARKTLERFAVGPQLDWEAFEETLLLVISRIPAQHREHGIRAYGEMVDLLWADGHRQAAITLEEYWNRVLETMAAQLFCSYSIDVLDEEFGHPDVERLVHVHSAIATEPAGEIESVLDRALDDFSISKDDAPDDGVSKFTGGQRIARWVLEAHSDRAGQVFDRAKQYRRYEARFRALTENIADFIVIVDGEGTIRYATDSVTRVLGWEPQEVVRRKAASFLHGDDIAVIGAKCSGTPQGGSVSMDCRLRRKAGGWAQIESVISNRVDDPDIRGLIVTGRDVSGRPATGLGDAAGASARRAPGDRAVAAAASMFLKTPLRKIRTYASLLASEKGLGEPGQGFAASLQDEARAMSAMIDDLVTYMSVEAISKGEQAGIEFAVQVAIEELRPIIESTGANVIVDSLPPLRFGVEAGRVLFLHLISNAIYYRGQYSPEIRISTRRLDRSWIVSVEDNGVGIAAEHFEYVFELFARIQPGISRGGGGGLAICRKIVETRGGRIWAESRPGGGSAFRFALPHRPL